MKTYDEDGNVTGKKAFDITNLLILRDLKKTCDQQVEEETAETLPFTGDDNFTYPGRNACHYDEIHFEIHVKIHVEIYIDIHVNIHVKIYIEF